MENSRPLAIVGTKTITENDISEVIAGMGPRAESYNTPQGRAAVLEQLILKGPLELTDTDISHLHDFGYARDRRQAIELVRSYEASSQTTA